MTRWEKFAKAKGITKQKKSKMVYDEALGDFKPRFGYNNMNGKSKGNLESDWIIEVPGNASTLDVFFFLDSIKIGESLM
jgi:regulator of ribosome biosynthesis